MMFSDTWLSLLKDLILKGDVISPRGKTTRELLQHTIRVDMRYPVLAIPARKLSYVFMIAEAYWIMSGDNRVSTIAPYNKNIAQFSDDGETFFGAYGPKVIDQLQYVVDKLIEDPNSRQAGINIWRENPPQTKDVPCTVTMFFNIRGGKLNMMVFMRSSDAWLGVPYDVFNFAMIAHLVCTRVNVMGHEPDNIVPGTLHLTMGSSHIYESDVTTAMQCIKETKEPLLINPTPDFMWKDEVQLMNSLGELKDLPPDSDKRWWVKS